MGFIGSFQGSSGRLASQLGEALGMGLGEFTGSYFANKALEDVIKDPNLKNADQQERLTALQQKLAPYGARGERMLIKQIELEGKKEEKQSAKLANKYLRGEKLTTQEEESLSPDIIAKKQQLNRPGKVGATTQPVPLEVAQKMRQIAESNPNASAEELEFDYAEAGIPPIYYGKSIESRRRTDEKKSGKLGDRDESFIKENRGKTADLALSKAASNSIINSIASGKVDPISLANLAERTGIKELMSPEGAALASGAKTFLISDLSNINGRANEYLERRIADSLARIGQGKNANAAAARMMVFKVEAQEKWNEIVQDLIESDEYPPGKLETVARKKFDKWQDPAQSDFLNDMDQIAKGDISSIENRVRQSKGQSKQLTDSLVDEYLQKANGNVELAEQMAQEDGYGW